jgi:outer membrane lipoprotein-sorting protein
MTQPDPHESEFSRLLQGLPCDDAPRPEHHEALRERALREFDRAASAEVPVPGWKHALQQGREIMRRPVPRLIAVTAACLAIAVTWLFVPGPQSTAQAFNRFAEAVVAAKTAKFTMEVNIEGQPKQKFQAYYRAPGKYRQELAGMVNISDLEAGIMMNISPAEKRVMIMNLKGAPDDKKKNSNYFDRLRELLAGSRDGKDNQYERLGEKTIDGKKAVGFRLDTPADSATLWGDPATGAPLRIESVFSGLPRTEVVMADFEINVDLQESLFDTKPPEGYKVQSMDVDASAAREQDLVLAFTACAEISGGDFPDTLDMAGLNKLVMKFTLERIKNKEEVSEEVVQGLMKQSITIGRGFQFALTLPESADAHYAGKGVKRDAKERPIFWYKPEKSDKYRVLYGDLTVQNADAAPQVDGAKKIEKASQTSKPGAL